MLEVLGDDLLPEGDTPVARLEAARRRRGLTRKTFAARVGLDEGSICRWVQGERQPSPWMAARIEAILVELGDVAPATYTQPTYFDLTRWRRTPPSGARPRTFGERLRAQRLELGLSQAEAARRMGVSLSAVHRWERGECEPNSKRLKCLQRCFER